MAWWKMSESIYFDWVLYDMFSWLGEYDEAFCRWSDDRWRSEFAEKLSLREYSEDINGSVMQEFERFLPWRSEELSRQKVQEEEERKKKEQQEKEDRELQEELARERERPNIPFEDILNEVFDNFDEVISAVCEWSEEEWHEKFEERIRIKMDGGFLTEETAVQIRKDLQEYIQMFFQDEEECEKGEEEREEEERRKQEQWEREMAETKAREQRKVKQLPQVTELIEQYQQAKKILEEDISEEAYHHLFDKCFNVINNWGLLSCLDEFNDVWGYYEKSVLNYLHNARTVDSLYHVVMYYTDSKLVWEISDMPERKKHIQKGIPFAKLLYETLENEDSALRYVDCYLQLDQSCRTGEDLEQLSYADKAYKLAKSFVLKFRTERLLEEFEMAKLSMTLYYRIHEQEMYAREVEEEYEKIKKEIGHS